jgi:hypothetical protein
MIIKRHEQQFLPCPVCGQSCRAEVVLKHNEAASVPQTSKEPIAWMWRDYTGYRQIGWKYPGAMTEDATPLYADTRPDRKSK